MHQTIDICTRVESSEVVPTSLLLHQGPVLAPPSDQLQQARCVSPAPPPPPSMRPAPLSEPPAPSSNRGILSNQGFSTADAINHLLEVMPPDIRRDLTAGSQTQLEFYEETQALAPPSYRRVSPPPPPPAPTHHASLPHASSSKQGLSTAHANLRDLESATLSETEPETQIPFIENQLVRPFTFLFQYLIHI